MSESSKYCRIWLQSTLFVAEPCLWEWCVKMTMHCIHVQGDYRRLGQDVIWFLITDSSLIRREVRKHNRCAVGSC